MSLVSGLLTFITALGADIKDHETRLDDIEASGGVTGVEPSALNTITGANVASGDMLFLTDIDAVETKSLTAAQLLEYLKKNGFPRVKACAGDHTLSSTTGTEVTDLSMTLEPGTYVVDWYLILQSATTSVSPMLGINFTGTAAVKTFIMLFADSNATLGTDLHTMDDEGVNTAGLIDGRATKTYSTTAPNLGSTATLAVATANSDTPVRITGVFIVTASGDLELWHSSETATATSVKAGSSVTVVRTA